MIKIYLYDITPYDILLIYMKGKSETSRIIVSARVRPLNKLEMSEGGGECIRLDD